MIYFYIYLACLTLFWITLSRHAKLYSEAHHFWYGSTTYWMGVTLIKAGWWKLGVALVVISSFVMLDDSGEHLFRFSLIRTIYGKLGGTR